MPVKIYWLVEHKVSYFKYIGDVTLEELQEAAEIGIQMLDESTDTPLVHTLQDGQAMTQFPSNLGQVAKLSRAAHTHPQMGWSISVGILEPITKFISATVSQIMRSRQRFTDTLPEALTFLNHVDATLPDLTTIDRDALTLYARVDENETTRNVPSDRV
ncbi:MAG: hypothetical protein AAF125_02345 [Chloroflexota bacterium]